MPWDKRTEIHHLCANSTSFNQFRGTETTLHKGGGSSPSYDVFSDISKQACEVKTSSFPDPNGPDPFIANRWRQRLQRQIPEQKRWAEQECGYSYCVIVNQDWLAKMIAQEFPGTRVEVRKDCNTFELPPDPVEPNMPDLD
jgi:hypothetical protein